MVFVRLEKIRKAEGHWEQALEAYRSRQQHDELPFLTVCKTVEVLMEYLWKEFKERAETEGLFAVSPKEAIRQAAALGIISEPDRWIKIILARNDSVHDYFGIPEPDYVELAGELLRRARAIRW